MRSSAIRPVCSAPRSWPSRCYKPTRHVTRPDLQPTERLPILADEIEAPAAPPTSAPGGASNVVGQRVDRFVVIGLQGVRDVVDAVGGVDINVPQAIHDDTYPTDDYGYQTVDIPAGSQRMDGDLALKYARTRHQDSDFARTARQQQVLGAVRNAMLNPFNWPRIPAVTAALLGSIKTDLTPLDAIAVRAAMLRTPGDADH